ncbi:hypothetical protein EV356DRAFT_182562 [Viridothelium virens]|uniref:Uncharacterized protein n=1 Tax=Viridothelium virens TaxID=1048519 RepID=A0A6A6H7B9_VIRVR|nr:hypothetical protein EV356DRAFT_182562 [Viridothelium virens]
MCALCYGSTEQPSRPARIGIRLKCPGVSWSVLGPSWTQAGTLLVSTCLAAILGRFGGQVVLRRASSGALEPAKNPSAYVVTEGSLCFHRFPPFAATSSHPVTDLIYHSRCSSISVFLAHLAVRQQLIRFYAYSAVCLN